MSLFPSRLLCLGAVARQHQHRVISRTQQLSILTTTLKRKSGSSLSSTLDCTYGKTGRGSRSLSSSTVWRSSQQQPSSHPLPSPLDLDNSTATTTTTTTLNLARRADVDAVYVCTGANRGLGFEFVRQLLTETHGTVYGLCRDPESAHELVALSDAHPNRMHIVRTDLTVPADIASLPSKLSEMGGHERVDFLINTAGILHGSNHMPERALREVTAEWMETNFKINTVAPLLMTQALAPLMKTKVVRKKKQQQQQQQQQQQRPPSVVANLSARVGSIGDNRLGGWYSYRISKAAQNMATRTMALELARQNTIVIGLHPGTVRTGLSGPFQKGVAEGKLFEPEFSVAQMRKIIEAVEPTHSGHCFAWDGVCIPF